MTGFYISIVLITAIICVTILINNGLTRVQNAIEKVNNLKYTLNTDLYHLDSAFDKKDFTTIQSIYYTGFRKHLDDVIEYLNCVSWH